MFSEDTLSPKTYATNLKILFFQLLLLNAAIFLKKILFKWNQYVTIAYKEKICTQYDYLKINKRVVFYVLVFLM